MPPIARCCVCEQRVRIPDVDATAWVRCPHCREEYQLERLAHDLPPRLEVVGERPLTIDSEANDRRADAAAGSALKTNRQIPEARLNVPLEGTSVPVKLELEEGSVLPQVDTSSTSQVKSPQTLHANRVKKAGRSEVFGFVKVVLGGVAGLMLGQIILWWLPQPYQSDPIHLARHMPAGLQFVLPPNLRASVEDTQARHVGRAGDPMPADRSQASDAVVDDALASNLQAAHVPATDLKYSLQTAVAENMAFDGHSSHEPRFVQTWYSSLKQLAYCATNIESMEGVNTEVIEAMTRFLQSIHRDTAKVVLIASAANKQLLADPPRNREGIVVAGTVASIRDAGELYRTSLRPVGARMQAKQIDVISRTDPRTSKAFQRDDELLILGVVVTNPATELQGYKGPAVPVVFGGFPVRQQQARTNGLTE